MKLEHKLNNHQVFVDIEILSLRDGLLFCNHYYISDDSNDFKLNERLVALA